MISRKGNSSLYLLKVGYVYMFVHTLLARQAHVLYCCLHVGMMPNGHDVQWAHTAAVVERLSKSWARTSDKDHTLQWILNVGDLESVPGDRPT